MSQFDFVTKTFVASGAVPTCRRVKLITGTTVGLAGADDVSVGVSDETVADGQPISVRLLGGGTHRVCAASAITAPSLIYGAADGKVDNTGASSASLAIGQAFEDATVDGDIIESNLFSAPMDGGGIAAHALNGAMHTVAGLTTGHVLQALSATTFGFAAAAGGGGLDFSKVVLLGCNPSSVGGAAGILGTYTTIQAALNAVPQNTTADLGTRTHIILVPPGTYDEDLTIAIEAKKIVMVAMGMVNLGKMSGSSNTPTTGDTRRGITIDPPHDWDINGVRASFHLMSFTGHIEAMETHPSYASKWRFSGLKFAAGSQGVGWEITISDCEIFEDGTSGLAIDGTLVTGGYPMLYGFNSRIRAAINFAKADLSYFHRTAFNADISCRSFSFLEACQLDGNLTVTTNGWWTPLGIVSSKIDGTKTFSGAAALVLDAFTDAYGGGTMTLAGGATRTVRENISALCPILAPSASARNVIVPTAATVIPLTVKGASAQTANLQEWQDSGANVLSSVDKTGAYTPASMADSAAANGTLYYSTTASKLVYKDSGGTVNALY